jgi:hypothetical protein
MLEAPPGVGNQLSCRPGGRSPSRFLRPSGRPGALAEALRGVGVTRCARLCWRTLGANCAEAGVTRASGCGAILHNTSYGRAVIGFARPEDHNLYYVNIAWDGFQRGWGAIPGRARNERARVAWGSVLNPDMSSRLSVQFHEL